MAGTLRRAVEFLAECGFTGFHFHRGKNAPVILICDGSILAIVSLETRQRLGQPSQVFTCVKVTRRVDERVN
jgi:hypothetical protein